jgi:hypothetical protein
MNDENEHIVRRDFQHGKLAYGFQWNVGNHKRLGKNKGDLASLWAHLLTLQQGKIPEAPFTDPLYTRASRLRLKKMSAAARVGLRRKFFKSGKVIKSIDNPLIELIRNYHVLRNDNSFCADHTILKEFIESDENTIAIEVPVWSERYNITGHIYLVRFCDDTIQVCDYKPGSLETTTRRFMQSLPQVSAYGELMAIHLANTLRSAFDAPTLPNIQCCIFDTHSCWTFGAELFVTLQAAGLLEDY